MSKGVRSSKRAQAQSAPQERQGSIPRRWAHRSCCANGSLKMSRASICAVISDALGEKGRQSRTRLPCNAPLSAALAASCLFSTHQRLSHERDDLGEFRLVHLDGACHVQQALYKLAGRQALWRLQLPLQRRTQLNEDGGGGGVRTGSRGKGKRLRWPEPPKVFRCPLCLVCLPFRPAPPPLPPRTPAAARLPETGHGSGRRRSIFASRRAAAILSCHGRSRPAPASGASGAETGGGSENQNAALLP